MILRHLPFLLSHRWLMMNMTEAKKLRQIAQSSIELHLQAHQFLLEDQLLSSPLLVRQSVMEQPPMTT
jgi:hypothetical protein